MRRRVSRIALAREFLLGGEQFKARSCQSLWCRNEVSACRFPGRPNTRPSGETTGQWDAHRYAYAACLPTVVASRCPTKRVSSESLAAEYQGISQPMKSRYRALSSYGPWQNVA